MSVRHVIFPGGLETVCGWPLSDLPRFHQGHTAGHSMAGAICRSCRAALRASPQLVNAIAAELRDSGHRCDVGALRLEPARRPG